MKLVRIEKVKEKVQKKGSIKKSSIDQMKTVKRESCYTNTLYHSTTGFIPKLNNA